MNRHISQWEVIQAGARKTEIPGMSDDQLANEFKAQEYLTEAVTAFRTIIRNVNVLSSVEHIDAEAFEAFVHDELPTIRGWDEKIAEARRG